jgi:hypothetical protein
VTDAELVRHKALELLLLVRSGLLDPHLDQVLAGVLDRMRDPGYDPPTPPRGPDPNDPDSWPSSGLFAPRDGG